MLIEKITISKLIEILQEMNEQRMHRNTVLDVIIKINKKQSAYD